MLSKLIHRPVGVLLSVAAAVIVGLLAAGRLPVGLLPEVGIPRLSVQITYPNAAARSLENSVVAPLRQQLLQVNGLSDIHSRSYDERAIIYLDFPFGTNPDLAFIEVNEQIDRAMNVLPKELPRPRVLATDIGDLPVVDLSITLADNRESAQNELLNLSDLGRRLFRRRLEQLPEIAFADLSGQLDRRITVVPDRSVLEALDQVDESSIATLLANANLETGNLLLADGHFVYNVRLSNRIRSVEDLGKLTLNSNGRLLRLDEIAELRTTAVPPRGYFFQDGRAGIVFSLRKKADARLFDLRDNLDALLNELRTAYSDYRFELTNDQTRLLTASIENLRTGLLYGAGFAILVLFAFFREWRRPLLIGLAVPVALIIALLGFYLVDLSVNVISLAGLILGLGLMIDNSIIVLDNIRQLRQEGLDAVTAAQRGADEVIRPLISSALTTVAVFLPLILLSGVAGALFRDQAIAVTLALAASLLVAYFLLPLLSRHGKGRLGRREAPISSHGKTHRWPGWKSLGVLLVVGGLGWLLIRQLPVTGFPVLSRTGFQMTVDWNQNIPLSENERRSREIARAWRMKFGGRSVTEAGEHRYLLNEENRAVNASELRFFLDQAEKNTAFALDFLKEWQQRYPNAIIAFTPLPNLFDRIFSSGQLTPLIVKARQSTGRLTPSWRSIQPVANALSEAAFTVVPPARTEAVGLALDYENLRRTRVDPTILRRRLLTLFSENEVTRLREGDQNLAVVLAADGGESGLSLQRLKVATVTNRDGNEIPLDLLLDMRTETDYKRITADRSGEYAAVDLPLASEATDLSTIRSVLAGFPELSFQLDGSLFTDRERVGELSGVLLVSLLLLYLILAAQFESLRLPLVVLLVVPLSLVGALFALWIMGRGINLVSLIGMVVTGGIVVNDAIIKLEMIQRGRRELGLDRHAAIRYANRRRIQAILMTSLTTILALAPVLFTDGLGAELQQPLAVAVIGGLLVGTLASLYFLPLVYLALEREGRITRAQDVQVGTKENHSGH